MKTTRHGLCTAFIIYDFTNTCCNFINRGFATMSDVRGRDKNTEDSEKFFAGGSEHRFVDVRVF